MFCPLMAFTLLATAQIQEAGKREFSLEECIALATENYPLVKRYNLIDLSKEFTINNINKSYLPQPSLSLKGSYQSDVTSVPVIVPGMAIDPMSKDQYSAILSIEQLIWDGGAAEAGKKQAVNRSVYERGEVEVEIYNLKERIQSLFFGILLTESYLNEITVAEREIERLNGVVAAFIESGIANSSDMDALLVEKVSLSQRRRELSSDRKSYITMLSAMTGVKMDESTKLLTPETSGININSLIKRPELDLFKAGQEIVEQEKDIITSRNKPKFGAFVQLGYGRPGLNMLKDEFKGFYIAGVRMVWSIGSLYTAKNEKRIQDLKFSSIDSQRESFLYNVNVKRSGSSEKIRKIEELLAGDEEMVAIRSRLVQFALVKLEAGSISVSDYLKELNLLDGARCTRGRRKIELLMSIYEMKHILNN